MTSDVKITISTKDKSSPEVKKVGAAFDDLKKKTGEISKPVKNLQSAFSDLKNVMFFGVGAAVAFGAAVKKALDLGKEGAQIEFTAGKFDRLSTSIGTTSSALMSDLKTATRGTVSDLDLMTAATDFLALGLAKDHGEVVRLTSVAGKLGMDMNQLVLTLTNMTTMRFDALGVSVDGFDEKVKKLEQSGLDAATAFRQAFLEQAEQQIARVGDVADTNAGKIMQFEAAAENLSSTFKLKLAPAVTAVYQELFKLIATTEEQMTAMGTSREAIRDTSETYEEYRQEMSRALTLSGMVVDENGRLFLGYDAMGEAIWDTSGATQFLTEEQWKAYEIAQLLGDERQENIQRLHAMTGQTLKAAAAERDLKQAMSDLKQMIAGELGKEIDNFNEKQVELKEKANELKLKIEELEKLKYLTPEQAGELAGLKTDLGEVEQAITDTADAHDAATKRILFNILTQRAEMDGLTQAEYDALLLVAEGWGLIDESTAGAMRTADAFFDSIDSDAELTQAELMEINNIINSWPTEHNLNFHTKYTSSGSAPPYLDPDAKAGPKQHGGPVKGDTPYLVGEKGPEIFMPSQGGNIVPNWKTEQITNNWNMTINEAGRSVDPARSFALMQALAGV